MAAHGHRPSLHLAVRASIPLQTLPAI
jgi:hypothetical protein